MKAFLLPVLLAAVGAGAGVGAGLFLRPAPDAAPPETAATQPASEAAEGADPDGPASGEVATGPGTHPMPDRDRPPVDQLDFVRMSNQFVVPVLRAGDVRALVVVSIGLEIRAGKREVVFQREPKLRDVFLRVMFDHANAGGFDGTFTAGPQIETLRQSLWEAARPILGADVFDVLITDIARQDS